MSEELHAIIERLRQALRGMEVDAFTGVFADDAVYELRFGMPGQPRRYEGVRAIREHMRQGVSGGLAGLLAFDDVGVTVHETTDPEVAVVEFEPTGTVRTSGAPFRFASSIGVIRVRDGAVVSYLDYPNPLGAAEAAGMEFQLRTTAPAEATVKQMIDASAANDHEALLALYAPDVVIEIPFAPPGVPTRSVGRDRFRDRLEGVRGLRRFERADVVSVRPAAEPEVVVAEFTLYGTVIATGEPFATAYIMVVTVRDGLIVHSRDYGIPVAAA
ncbi:nuclear transport factor 2 family protein [Nonomuraea sp. NPDC049419]|uniref:nuclear transport factor 2 family protein n=1 Tax=Nonomuraea sp. NPDC049419 TaxID=3155772 RepID=UPI0034352C2F